MTDEEIEAVCRWQQSDRVDPLVCPCFGPEEWRLLEATREGLKCPLCGEMHEVPQEVLLGPPSRGKAIGIEIVREIGLFAGTFGGFWAKWLFLVLIICGVANLIGWLFGL